MLVFLQELTNSKVKAVTLKLEFNSKFTRCSFLIEAVFRKWACPVSFMYKKRGYIVTFNCNFWNLLGAKGYWVLTGGDLIRVLLQTGLEDEDHWLDVSVDDTC